MDRLFLSHHADAVTTNRRSPRSQVRRLQDVALQQEREKLQQHAAWTQEKQLMEKELSLHKEKVRHAAAATITPPS